MTLEPQGYRTRLIEPYLDRCLRNYGAVSIEGPKLVGKTWTAESRSESEIRISESDGPISNKDLVSADVRRALAGERPHLIDEWQEVPSIWDTVRTEVDRSPENGRFILTGSSVINRKEYDHSGAGRIMKINMRSMTLYESGDSDGKVSLKDIFDSKMGYTECKDICLDDLIRYVIRGGWPRSIDVRDEDAGLIPAQYVPLAVEDACLLDGKDRNRNKMAMLLRSLARNESTTVNDTTVIEDMKRYDDETISREVYDEYLDCLDRIHLIEETPSFRPNIRSNLRIGKTPKRHLTDVSLAVAALRLNGKLLKKDLNTFGFLFESLCNHDLKVYCDSLGWNLFHYRDGRGHEIDAVIETDDGRWGAFEIKLGFGEVDAAAENLLKMSKIFSEEGKAPSVLCVICGLTRYAYERPDGVIVIPITSLKP